MEDVIGESSADETPDVPAQRRIGVTEKLFQRGPVAGLRKKNQQSLVAHRWLLRLRSRVHALREVSGPLKVRSSR